LVNQTFPIALERLGCTPEQFLNGEHGLKKEQVAIFDCAHQISALGHLLMVSALLPFVSGSISKTVNMPYDATVEEIEDVYFQAYKLGIKSIAVYRDRSRQGQPYCT
jgi:ribonucleoside-diphosphate reductase alpha chain